MATSRLGESTYIDKATNEVKGRTSGKVYGKGNTLAESLAIQNQVSSGSTPTVSGRPDLYAIEPTTQEKTSIAPISGASGQAVTPRTATPEEMSQSLAGTLTSFNKATTTTLTPEVPTIPATPVAPPTPTTYQDAIREATKTGADTGYSNALGAPESYDNQIIRQKAALLSALLGDAVTPEDLRWLNPSQQNAIRSGKKEALEAELVGLKAIQTGRSELKKEEQAQAEKQYELFASSGTPVDQLPVDFLNKLDDIAGVPRGTYASVYRTQIAKDEQERQAAELETTGKILDVLGKLPPGQTIEIGGTIYSSINPGDVQTFTETASDGSMYLISYNKDTGENTVTRVGNFGNQKYQDIKSNEGAIVRVFDDGTQRVIFNPNQPNGGYATGGMVDLFPEGSVTPFTRPNDPNKDLASECGAWFNDITGSSVGNSYASKIALADPSITAETAQIGSGFVQAYGTTGHIGVINGKSVVNGEVVFTVSESNWSKVAGTSGKVGAITHTRQVKASEISGYIQPSFAQDFYNFGTGASNLEGLTFGTTTSSTENAVAESLTRTTNNINDLINSDGLRGSVGVYGVGRFTPFTADKAERADFVAGVEQLVSQQTLDSLLNLKAQGGTLGALSDSERTMLENSASKINSWKIKDDTGKVTGYEISEDLFKKELNNLKNITNSALARASGTTSIDSIRVKDKTTGQTGTIPSNEFDSAIYEKL